MIRLRIKSASDLPGELVGLTRTRPTSSEQKLDIRVQTTHLPPLPIVVTDFLSMHFGVRS